jgi:hypothetical protein
MEINPLVAEIKTEGGHRASRDDSPPPDVERVRLRSSLLSLLVCFTDVIIGYPAPLKRGVRTGNHDRS